MFLFIEPVEVLDYKFILWHDNNNYYNGFWIVFNRAANK